MTRDQSPRNMKVLEKAGEDSVYESAALPTELRRLDLDSKCARRKGKDRLYLYLLSRVVFSLTNQRIKNQNSETVNQ